MLGEGSGWDLRVRPAPAASGNLEIWKSGTLESKNLENKKRTSLEYNSVSPKMSARSGLVGTNPPDPFSGHFRMFLRGPEK